MDIQEVRGLFPEYNLSDEEIANRRAEVERKEAEAAEAEAGRLREIQSVQAQIEGLTRRLAELGVTAEPAHTEEAQG